MPLPAIAFGGVVASASTLIARFVIPYVVIKLALALGITTFSITGSVWLTGYIEGVVTSQFNSIGADVGAILIMAGMLDALAILFNAWVVALQIKGLKGAFKGLKFI